jgi:cell division protein FtsI (penicillin-binding protein 3)
MISASDRLKPRMKWVALGATFFGILVLGRAFSIQVMTDPRLERMARRQFQSKVLMSPRRGSILDRNGEALAVNIETSSLAANPTKIRGRKNLVRLLARALDMPYERLQSRMKEKREFVWLRRHLSERELNLLKKSQIIAADGDLVEGLWLVRESKRVYPHHELASHLLGTTNVDNDGLEGVELWFNSSLKGKVVSVETTRDALGRPTFLDASVARSVKDGENVRLTLDASLQYSVQQELKRSVEKTGSRGGSVIVMNAVNGEILAMANEPAYDPNIPGSPPANRRNRAVTDGYEPGSTLKPVLLAAALSRGMKLSDQIWGNQGSFKVQGKTISEAEAHEKFEWVSLKKMIQVSSNVVSAKLALKIGADQYLKVLQSLGFGGRTGIGFPGEISGRIPPRKSWQPLTLANIGFGQGILVTPIQMVRAYASFLNGGWLVDPVLITGEHELTRQPPRRVYPASVAEGVVTALSAVTEEGGTGGKAVVDGYRVAGKTGTAQIVDPNTGKYSRSRYISSFIGFATGVDPKVVIYTALDGPKGVYYASETAAPLFKGVLAAVVNRFSMPSDPQLVRHPKDEPHEQLAGAPQHQDAIETAQAHSELPIVRQPANQEASAAQLENSNLAWKMPSLIGLTAREALRALQGRPYEIEMEGRGVIRSQHPEAGNTVAEHATIRLSLSAQ